MTEPEEGLAGRNGSVHQAAGIGLEAVCNRYPHWFRKKICAGLKGITCSRGGPGNGDDVGLQVDVKAGRNVAQRKFVHVIAIGCR